MRQPRSTTTLLSRAWRPTRTSGSSTASQVWTYELTRQFENSSDRRNVAPISLGFRCRLDATLLEGVSNRQTAADQVRNHVFTEIMARPRVPMIAFELGIKEVGGEHVDTHAGERAVGFAGHSGRIFGFFQEVGDRHRIVDRHDPEVGSLLDRHLDTGDRATGAFVD